jgi:hypothetical protein
MTVTLSERTWRRRLVQAYAMSLALLVVRTANAQPLVAVQSDQDCPAQADVEAEVRQWSLREAPTTDVKWRAVVDHPGTNGARMRLFSEDGALVLERSIQSDDCVALAKAFAIILETHFLDLGLVLPRETQDELEPEPKPAPKPSPPPPKPKLPAKSSAQKPSGRVRVALGVGAQWATPDPGFTGTARALVGIAWQQRWAVDLALNVGLPQEQEGAYANDRVKSQGASASVLLAHRVSLGSSTWWEPHVGVGARVTQLEAPQVAGQDTLTATILGELGLATGLHFTPNWSGRFDVVGQLLTDRDRYVIVPYGAVGQGPRALFLATLGLELGGL